MYTRKKEKFWEKIFFFSKHNFSSATFDEEQEKVGAGQFHQWEHIFSSKKREKNVVEEDLGLISDKDQKQMVEHLTQHAVHTQKNGKKPKVTEEGPNSPKYDVKHNQTGGREINKRKPMLMNRKKPKIITTLNIKH